MRYKLIPIGAFLLALLGGLAVAMAQTIAPQTIVGGQYNATPPTFTDKQLGAIQLDSSGTFYANVRGSTSFGSVAPGTAPINSVLMGAIYNATPPVFTNGQAGALQLNSDGSLSVKTANEQSYSATIVGLVPPATPTDIFCLTGSATKTVVLKRVDLSGTATALTVIDVLITKHSTADTGGTSTAPTAVPHDSTNAAATAAVAAYTVNPTVGTVVGTLDGFKMTLSTTATQNNERIKLYGTEELQAIRLRGTSEQACINLNGVTTGGNNYDISIDWTER